MKRNVIYRERNANCDIPKHSLEPLRNKSTELFKIGQTCTDKRNSNK